eukprot:11186396-Lingulodinium_polyedra.AAC.1
MLPATGAALGAKVNRQRDGDKNAVGRVNGPVADHGERARAAEPDVPTVKHRGGGLARARQPLASG